MLRIAIRAKSHVAVSGHYEAWTPTYVRQQAILHKLRPVATIKSLTLLRVKLLKATSTETCQYHRKATAFIQALALCLSLRGSFFPLTASFCTCKAIHHLGEVKHASMDYLDSAYLSVELSGCSRWCRAGILENLIIGEVRRLLHRIKTQQTARHVTMPIPKRIYGT